ncbi:ras-related protein Rab-33B [Sigmodon hispidus]
MKSRPLTQLTNGEVLRCRSRWLTHSICVTGLSLLTSFLFPTLQIQLWDTAGQERFRKSMVQHYYRNVHAVVFVYDMTNMASFHSLPSWIEECKQHLLASDIPRILVGNKCDLRSAIQVPTDLAQKFADTHSMPLFETSAKNPNDNDHVEAIFMTLAHKLKSHKPLMLSQPPDNRISLKPETKPAVTCWC